MKTTHRIVLAGTGLMAATALLAGCSRNADLWVVNTCGQDISVGFQGSNDAPTDEWHSVEADTTLELSVSGYSSVLLTVLPAGAERVAAPSEVDLDDLEWIDRPTEVEYAELDLAATALCR